MSLEISTLVPNRAYDCAEMVYASHPDSRCDARSAVILSISSTNADLCLISQRNPMNARDPVEGYEEHLGPVIRGAREARLDTETDGGGGPRLRAKL